MQLAISRNNSNTSLVQISRPLSRSSSFHSLVNLSSSNFSVEDDETFGHSDSFEAATESALIPEILPNGKCFKFQKRLSEEIQSVVQDARNSAKRAPLLHNLFDNLRVEIDNSVLADVLASDGDFMQSILFPTSRAGLKTVLHYYELIADYYSRNSMEAENLYKSLEGLWSNVHAPSIYAMLLYPWLFSVSRFADDPHLILKRIQVFLKGANRAFWYDMETSSHFFRPMYMFLQKCLREGRAGVPIHFFQRTTPEQGSMEAMWHMAVADINALVFRFFFYYDSAQNLRFFLDQVSMRQGSKMTVANGFINEMVRHLGNIRNEIVVMSYLEGLVACKGLDVNAATQIRWQMIIFGFSVPGGPLYPTRPIRVCARRVHDVLFPTGRHSRKLIAFLFRLVHPYYSASSTAYWVRVKLRRYLPNAVQDFLEQTYGALKASANVLRSLLHPVIAVKRGIRQFIMLPRIARTISQKVVSWMVTPIRRTITRLVDM
mmetsp:Transcript_39319/g.63781  ORF Transcript_39319/g.63781 Transcript_39319/m.63781 type:complete len:489 (-) Transcript_39319:381-1847(-)